MDSNPSNTAGSKAYNWARSDMKCKYIIAYIDLLAHVCFINAFLYTAGCVQVKTWDFSQKFMTEKGPTRQVGVSTSFLRTGFKTHAVWDATGCKKLKTRELRTKQGLIWNVDDDFILLNVLYNTSWAILLPWQHTAFQSTPILMAFLATFGITFWYFQMASHMHDSGNV